tara:strand:+ start:9325 stop:10194 length:870 start_codon:yes stop_codon:yes gene_type:complete
MTHTYSKIIAGTMTWGSGGKKLSKKDMMQLMHYCFDNEITTFDHADIYGGYTNENDFGRAFADSGIKRESVQLISKCGIQVATQNRKNSVKHYNYSKDYIIWSVENSLKYLKTGYLDLLLIHRPSPLMDPEEIFEAILYLKKQGKIKDFGVSNFTPSQIELFSKHMSVSVNQVEFSLTQNKAMYDGTLDQMMLKNIKPMAWSPLGSIYKESSEQTSRIKKQLGALSVKYHVTEDQLLLAWVLKHPSKIIPVIGSTDTTRIKNAMNATTIQLELEDWFLLLQASQGHEVP